ncbi:cation diffusion facilitator family transporter [Ktedonobacter racemifer]|uniref:Cation diffusion facilitator family transporter n=1 Tax=Ktedonobacter racemifer DSM 44963 TaxID=485913 RepID=D6TSW2_KTERA|nr:cation diffusion facilitator family transporter [Ktedonobacter racemifer]EFH83513.1 cation diffusion facilitator family transporter [Ktedonobacter racemifer DSM 44963]
MPTHDDHYHHRQDMQREKMLVALSSVGAAIGLTTLKLIVGLLTGSLGILAEAAHSGFDLIAALMTFFAVRLASRPADQTHHYGHEKIENLSAFLEALLLLLTAAWVIYEAVRRLLYHEGHVEISIWAFVVMGISIVVDVTRSRVLLRVARKVGSQALEADALHFSTDIWSSAVVIVGLLIVLLTNLLHLPSWLTQADAVAALAVSGIVIWVSIRLARDTLDVLLDKAPHVLLAPMTQRLRERIDDATSMHLTVGRKENMVEQTLCSSALFSSDTERLQRSRTWLDAHSSSLGKTRECVTCCQASCKTLNLEVEAFCDTLLVLSQKSKHTEPALIHFCLYTLSWLSFYPLFLHLCCIVEA